jgi:hypothetical protein
MRALWSALMGAYSRWRFVEDIDSAGETQTRRKSAETPEEEITRLRRAIARERHNLESFLRFDCRALAGPCESSIRAMESRIHALDFRKAV